jgi:hypothetical protein
MRWKKHFDITETTKRAQLIETTLEIVRRPYLETIETIEMTKRSQLKIAKTKWKTKFETIDIRWKDHLKTTKSTRKTHIKFIETTK